MRALALLTALVFATACGHKQPPPATTAKTQPADTKATEAKGDHDEAAEHKNGKDKDDDDDDDAHKK